MDWIAKSDVADTVYTMNDVTMSVDFVPKVVWTGILDDIATFVRFEPNYRKYFKINISLKRYTVILNLLFIES